jgi:primosomal protein N'
MLVQVSPSLNIYGDLTYRFTGDPGLIKPGLRVVIPIGNRLTTGWITQIDSKYQGKAKSIVGIIQDSFCPDQRFMAYLKEIAQTYFTSLGGLLDSSLYAKRRSINSLVFKKPKEPTQSEKLNKYAPGELQDFSREKPLEFLFKDPKALCTGKDTEPKVADPQLLVKNKFRICHEGENFYRETIERHMSENQSILILTPDTLTAKYLKEKFPQADLYNSQIKAKQMEELWMNYVLEGKIGIIIGGITAALLPLRNPGVVICDRAGSYSYKGAGFARYDVQLLAALRAKHYNIPLLESFPTYTVSAFKNRSKLAVEDTRDRDISVNVRRIKRKSKGIPGELVELLKDCYIRKHKILLVLNKKKSLRFLFCEACKEIQKCPVCGGLLKQMDNNGISCYRCGREKKGPNICLACKTDLSVIEDISIDSLKKIIQREIVETGIVKVSAEDLRKQGVEALLTKVKNNNFVISTPIILNPFFRRKFDSIIYVQPETHFSLDDYDAAEKVFSIVTELKELKKNEGAIDVFSTFYFHYSLKLINEEKKFFERELKYREWFHLPPFFNLYHIRIKNKEIRNLGSEMRAIYKTFRQSLKISRIYLASRKRIRGFFRGVLVAHATTNTILESNLVGKRNITVELELN